MGTTMITLVGGRLPPIVAIAAKHYEDLTDVYFLVSRDSESTYKRLHAIFNREFPKVVLHSIGQDGSSLVNPFDKSDIYEKCVNILRSLAVKNTRGVVQLTSGTQVMCVAAYEAAKKLNTPAIYVNTAGGEIIDLVHETKQPITSRVNVRFYCSIYGFQAKEDKLLQGLSISKQQAIELSRELAAQSKAHLWLGNKLRKSRLGQKSEDFFPVPHLNELELRLLNRFVELHLVQKKNNKIRVTSANWEYVTAKWLEAFTYDCAEQSNFFDDCQLSVQLNNEADCDVLCIKGGIPMIIECKTGGNLILSDLKSISQKAEMLGRSYCMKAIVYSGGFTRKVDEEKDKMKIECLSLEELRQDSGRLKETFLRLRKYLS